MVVRLSLRRWLSGWLIVAILFTQVATAAYACPVATGKATSAADMAGMPCAGMMASGMALDAEQPGLCLQHCQFDSAQQSADSPQPSFLAVAALPPRFTLPPSIAPTTLAASWIGHARSRERMPGKAHSVLHCCYRI